MTARLVSVGTSTSRRDRRPRTALLAEHRLVGDAVRTALNTRRLDVLPVAWPDGRRPTRAVCRALRAQHPGAGVVFGDLDDPHHRSFVETLVTTVPMSWALVVSRQDDVSWGDLVAAGATLLPTSTSIDDLVLGITQLETGADPMPSQTRDRMVREWRVLRDERDRVADRLDRLTPREAEVLDLLTRGVAVRDIAAASGVSEATVRVQVKAVLRKLEVSSQLAAVALVQGQRPDLVARRPAVRPGPRTESQAEDA